MSTLLKNLFSKGTLKSTGKYLGAGSLGTGIAALENEYLGSYLPEEMKKINLGIGATTGLYAALGGRKTLGHALSTLPFKQMGLFGVSAFERSRQQQEDLMHLNIERALKDLETAHSQKSTAEVESRTAQETLDQQASESSRKKVNTLLAALGVGAGGYYVWNASEKDRARRERERKRRKNPKTVATTTNSRPSSRNRMRIRIDLPPDASPDLLKELGSLSENERARTHYKVKSAFIHVLSR